MSEETFDIHYVAKLARLNLTEEEFKTMGTQVAQILSYVEQLQSVELGDDVAPTAHPIPMTNVTRPDSVKSSLSQQKLCATHPLRAMVCSWFPRSWSKRPANSQRQARP